MSYEELSEALDTSLDRTRRIVKNIRRQGGFNDSRFDKEYIPNDGPIIIAGNHKHLFDQCLSILATKRFIKYMAKREYFDSKKTKWFFKSVGCIPVDRSKKDENAKKLAIEHLDKGGAIGIFPEGTRNKTNKLLLDFKYGAVSMAKKTDAYIVPFAITGDYVFRSKNLKIIYGKPFKVNDLTMENANNKLYNEVRKLLKNK